MYSRKHLSASIRKPDNTNSSGRITAAGNGLQHIADNSSRVKQFRSYQEMADSIAGTATVGYGRQQRPLLQAKSGTMVTEHPPGSFAQVVQRKKTAPPPDGELVKSIQDRGFLNPTEVAEKIKAADEAAGVVPVSGDEMKREVPVTSTEIASERLSDFDDFEEEGAPGASVSSTVPAKKTEPVRPALTEKEKAEMIWKYVTEKYAASRGKGEALLAELKKLTDDYRLPEEKKKIDDKNASLNIRNSTVFREHYRTVPSAPSSGTIMVNSVGRNKKQWEAFRHEAKEDDIGENNYSNIMDAKEGHIRALYNNNDADNARAPEGPGHLPNSEILWHQYKLAATQLDPAELKVQESMKKIQDISRETITNSETLSTLYIASTNVEEKNIFRPPQEEFQALAGTPNGRSSMHMLIDHYSELQKEPDRVETFKNDMLIAFKPGGGA